jgi:multicomponent Na+:H+ antiporter subunit C
MKVISPFVVVVVLISIALLTILLKRNIIKITMAVHVMGSAVNLFFISLGYRKGGIAPIFTNAPGLGMVMPTPQALVLTSIVISMAVVALALSFAISIYARYGTLDTRKMRLKG